jgi:phosphopentomutase
MTAAGIPVFGVGKIRDIFAGCGIGDYVYSSDNRDGMAKTLTALAAMERGLIFTNLVDFDMLYGHRLDAKGFGQALEEFDRWLPECRAALKAEDLLIVTADHGCDPTTPGSDHTREYVPLLVWSPAMTRGTALGVRTSFADVAATLAEAYGLPVGAGKGFLGELTG